MHEIKRTFVHQIVIIVIMTVENGHQDVAEHPVRSFDPGSAPMATPTRSIATTTLDREYIQHCTSHRSVMHTPPHK